LVKATASPEVRVFAEIGFRKWMGSPPITKEISAGSRKLLSDIGGWLERPQQPDPNA
jgi:hypothetical protein